MIPGTHVHSSHLLGLRLGHLLVFVEVVVLRLLLEHCAKNASATEQSTAKQRRRGLLTVRQLLQSRALGLGVQEPDDRGLNTEPHLQVPCVRKSSHNHPSEP